MDAKEYQALAARTLIEEPDFTIPGYQQMLLWCAIGAAGEVGEIAELVKKAVLHQHGITPEFRASLVKEIGDASWYLAGLCTVMKIDFGAVLEANIEKLKKRYPNGFSSEDSIKRADTK